MATLQEKKKKLLNKKLKKGYAQEEKSEGEDYFGNYMKKKSGLGKQSGKFKKLKNINKK